MKKITIFVLIVMVSLLAACSQNSQNTAGNNPAPGDDSPPGQTNGQQEQKQEEKIDYPTKPVELILPFAAGGLSDSNTRRLVKYLSEYLPQPVVVINKPGGDGTIGLTDVANVEPDGYTIGYANNTTIAVNEAMGHTTFSYKDFDPIIMISKNPLTLFVGADQPWNTFEEWLEWAEQNPGKFSFSRAGAGSDMIMRDVAKKAGIGEVKGVSYKTHVDAITAVLQGDVQGVVTSTEAIPYLESGDLRPLAILGDVFPNYLQGYDIPTLKDIGLEAGFSITTLILAPKGTPEPIITILHDAFKKTIETPELIEEYAKINREYYYGSTEEARKDLENTYNISKEIFDSLNSGK